MHFLHCEHTKGRQDFLIKFLCNKKKKKKEWDYIILCQFSFHAAKGKKNNTMFNVFGKDKHGVFSIKQKGFFLFF